MIDIALATILGYLLGSIPFGLVLTRMFGKVDIRTIGSGNIVATNVLRTGSKGLALATLLLDGGKGAAAALLAGWIATPEIGVIAGVAAVIGHNFPVWLKFKGGKGVATSLGMLLAVAWPVGVAACLTWLATAVITRVSSLSALMALILAPVYGFVWSNDWVVIAAAMLGVLSILRHRANIKRLLDGTEPKIGKK